MSPYGGFIIQIDVNFLTAKKNNFGLSCFFFLILSFLRPKRLVEKTLVELNIN